MKTVVIDRGICLKAGQCYYLQPGVFRSDSEGWPEVIVEHPEDAELIEAAEDAVEICPSGAIAIEDDEAD